MLYIDWNNMSPYGESIWDANKDSIRWMDANSFFCDFEFWTHPLPLINYQKRGLLDFLKHIKFPSFYFAPFQEKNKTKNGE